MNNLIFQTYCERVDVNLKKILKALGNGCKEPSKSLLRTALFYICKDSLWILNLRMSLGMYVYPELLLTKAYSFWVLGKFLVLYLGFHNIYSLTPNCG